MPACQLRILRVASASIVRSTTAVAAIIAVAIVVLTVLGDPVRDALIHGFALTSSRLTLVAVGTLIGMTLVVDVLTSREKGANSLLDRPFRLILGPLSSIPTLVWITAIVVVSASIRVALAPANSVPTIFGDELVYSELAKGFAFYGVPVIRGELDFGYSLGYPLFASVAWLISSDATSAFGVLKVMNAVVMATSAIPAFFFAYRIVSRAWALCVAALTAFAPWTAYSAFVMTESLFYPAFTLFALLVVRMLERATRGRQLAVLVALVGLIGIRTQAAVLAGSVIAAIVLMRAVSGDVRGVFRPQALLVGGLCALGLGYVTLGVVGLPIPGGAYLALFNQSPAGLALVDWTFRNLAAYELAVGVVPFVAFPIALSGLLRRASTRSELAVGAAATTLAVGMLVTVVVLSATPLGLERLHERNLFYVTPLVLTCFAHWLMRGLQRPVRLTAGTVAFAALLPAALNADLLQRTPAIDSLLTSAFRGSTGWVLIHSRVWAIGLCAIGIVSFLVARRAVTPVLSVALAFGVLTAENVYPGDYVGRPSTEQTRALGWVDHTLPEGEAADIVYVSCNDATESRNDLPDDAQAHMVRWTEFFNVRIERVARLGSTSPGGLDSPALALAEHGLLLMDGRPVERRYLVVDSRWPLVGQPIARLEWRELTAVPPLHASLTLWRAELPVRLENSSSGPRACV